MTSNNSMDGRRIYERRAHNDLAMIRQRARNHRTARERTVEQTD